MLGVYPGTFNPPTIGHLEIIRAAITHLELDELHLVISEAPLAKARPARPTLPQRLEVIRASIAHIGAASVHTTERQLIADIASGYDAVVMGADKWRQIHDIAFYRDDAHRDEAIGSLPRVVVAARDDVEVPTELRLPLTSDVTAVSSTGAREGNVAWMTPAARDSGLWGEP